MSPRQAYYQNERPEVTQFIPDDYSRVLEVGCGEGNFRTHLSKSCEYWGIEPCREAAESAANKLDKVLVGRFDQLIDKIPENYFDLVICNDVIEHMEDHDFFLSEVRRKLSDDGIISGSVPNVRFWKNLRNLVLRKEWCYTDEGILDRTHLRFFTEKSFKRALNENGYKLLLFSGINGWRSRYYSPRKILASLAIAVLGDDLRYRQFGFCVQKAVLT